MELHVHRNPSWLAASELCLQQLFSLPLGQASGRPVAKTLDVIFPFSEQLLPLLFITQTYFLPLLNFFISFIFYTVFLPRTPTVFSFCSFILSPFPLQENQRMQQKIDTMTKEVFDLQETLLWKDKNIRV